MKTYIEQLESVQDAIFKIESGAQAHSISGRSMTKADLGTLYAREERLIPLARKEQGRGGSGNGGSGRMRKVVFG